MKVNLTKRTAKQAAKHRRLDGQPEVMAQTVVGFDGRLYRYSEPYHAWVGHSIGDLYPDSAPAQRQGLLQ